MDENNTILLFEDQAIRTAWDEEQEEWYFSIVDVVAVLTEQKTSRGASTYWTVLKMNCLQIVSSRNSPRRKRGEDASEQ